MTKSELIDLIHDKAATYHARQVSKADIAAVLDSLGEVAAELLPLRVDVPLPGLGKLKTVLRAGRQGRNPATGEAIRIAASALVKLSAAKSLKDALNP